MSQNYMQENKAGKSGNSDDESWSDGMSSKRLERQNEQLCRKW